MTNEKKETSWWEIALPLLGIIIMLMLFHIMTVPSIKRTSYMYDYNKNITIKFDDEYLTPLEALKGECRTFSGNGFMVVSECKDMEISRVLRA